MVKRLTGLRDLLGEMNDARTARNLLGGLYHKRASDFAAILLAHGSRFRKNRVPNLVHLPP